MIVVSDSSTIIGFDNISRLDILQSFQKEIIVPKAVYHEVTQKTEASKIDWIQVKEVQNQILKNEIISNHNLDIGEAEAIALAIELQADFLLIDEHKGRVTAKKYNLKITGLLGVLEEAKKSGYITKANPFLEELMEKTNYRISENLYAIFLKSVGENN